jgi:hypothetical protein
MRTATAGCLVFAGLMLSSVVNAQEKAAEAKVVKYDGLKDVVVKNKGKVVVVDFWGID